MIEAGDGDSPLARADLPSACRNIDLRQRERRSDHQQEAGQGRRTLARSIHPSAQKCRQLFRQITPGIFL